MTTSRSRYALQISLTYEGREPTMAQVQDALRKLVGVTSAPLFVNAVDNDNVFLTGLYVVGQQGYECPICGGDHTENLHGEPWYTQDVGRDTVENELGKRIEQLKLSIFCRDQVNDQVTMQEIEDSYEQDMGRGFPVEDPLEIDFSWYDMKLDQVAAANGFVICSDAEANAWWIYDAVDEQFFTTQRFLRNVESEELDS